MEIKVRKLPEDVVLKLDAQAKRLKISREEQIRRILTVTSFTPAESNLIYFQLEVEQKLAVYLQEISEFLKIIKDELEEWDNGREN